MSNAWGTFGEYGFGSDAWQGHQATVGLVRYWEIGEHRSLMQQLESFLDSVLETDQVPFDIRDEWGRERAVRNPKVLSDYRSLAGFVQQCGDWMDLYWPGYAYRADYQLFFDCFSQHPFAQVCGYGEPRVDDKARVAKLYNNFVNGLRMDAVRRGVKKSLSGWRSNLDDQEATIRRYLTALTALYPALVPIRLDLNYAEYAFDGDDALQRMGWAVSQEGFWLQVPFDASVVHGRAETRARIDTARAMADRDSFFDNQRGADKHLFERMVGYVCKLEQGGWHRANHFHCVFLMDARGLTQAHLEALKVGLGERWRRVTRGQGLTYDCHGRPDREAIRARGQWAIDALDCSDAMQVATFVNYVVWYLATGDDQMVRAKPTARARTLTTGR